MHRFGERCVSPVQQLQSAEEFEHLPVALRAHAFELTLVERCLKPGALLTLFESSIPIALKFLTESGLYTFLVPLSRHDAYQQTSPAARLELISKKPYHLYIARTRKDVAVLAKCDSGPYELLGQRLGYPDCCVKFASERDRTQCDPVFRVPRQTNLMTAAVKVSTQLDFRLNITQRESWLQSRAPGALISHYPCNFECPASVALAQTYAEEITTVAPLWMSQLNEILRSPTLVWDDGLWPPQLWDEFPGYAFIKGRVTHRDAVTSVDGAGRLLGANVIPAGELPDSLVAASVDDRGTALTDKRGNVINCAHAICGKPSVLDWATGEMFVG